MKQDFEVVHNFRSNFRAALFCDGRSLSALARDISTSTPYLSRIRSGSKYTDTGHPIVPGLDTCERIAQGLGWHLIDMIKSPKQFRRLLRKKYPDFNPKNIPELRQPPPGPRATPKRKAKHPRKKSPAA